MFKCLIYYAVSNQSFDRPPACTPSLKSVLSSTPNSVKASNVEPTVPCTPIVHSSTSNSIDPSQPITPTVSASKTTTSTADSKRRALFCKEEYEGSYTVVKTRLPDQLPFPDTGVGFLSELRKPFLLIKVLFVRRQLVADLASFYYALSKHPLQGDYKRMALAVCNKFPDLRDSNPSSYWVSFLNVYHFQFMICTGPRRATLVHVHVESQTISVLSTPTFKFYKVTGRHLLQMFGILAEIFSLECLLLI